MQRLKAKAKSLLNSGTVDYRTSTIQLEEQSASLTEAGLGVSDHRTPRCSPISGLPESQDTDYPQGGPMLLGRGLRQVPAAMRVLNFE